MPSLYYSSQETLDLLAQTQITLNLGNCLQPIEIDSAISIISGFESDKQKQFVEVKNKVAISVQPLFHSGLPPEAIRQFQEINRRKGIQISDEQATQYAYNFINLVRVVNGQKPILSLTDKKY